jgi:DNA-binding MarR family transcriptional regulator
MTEAEDLDPVTLEVYDFFRRQPGETFAVSAIAADTGYDADEVEAGLAQLVEGGYVEERGTGDATMYKLSDGAPEL